MCSHENKDSNKYSVVAVSASENKFCMSFNRKMERNIFKSSTNVILLSAGSGSRMGAMTADVPKSLGRCEQVPDMRSSCSSGAHPRGTS